MTQPSPAVAAAIARRQQQQTVDQATLEVVRAKAQEAKELELHIVELEEQLSQTKSRLQEIRFTELVDLMLAAGVDGLDIPAQGNMPAFNVKMKPYYYARINADAPEEQRIAAFKMLEDTGNGDLIKTVVTVNFPREARKEVADFIKKLPKTVIHEVNASVHWRLLESWLRETVEGGTMPPLELINGKVGKVVELKDKKP